MKTLIPVLTLVAITALIGCQQEKTGPTANDLAAQKMEQALQAGTGGSPIGGSTTKVEVSAEGTKFDPPVQVAQMPTGAWYCDMGTVHFARTSEGDGRCGVCGMTLTESP